MLAARWFRPGEGIEEPKTGFFAWFDRRYLRLESLYRRVLAWALRHRGFVEQDQNGNYRLGPSLLAIADSHLRDESLRSLIHDALAALCAKAGETCHLGVLSGEQVVYIDKVEPQRAIRIWSLCADALAALAMWSSFVSTRSG